MISASIQSRFSRDACAATATAPKNATIPAMANRGVSADSGRARRVAVLRCLVAALVVTILLAGLVVLVFWLVVRPKPIDYTVTRAVVRHFNVTPPPDARVNATFYLTLTTDNPNRRVSMFYDWVQFQVMYGEATQLAVADAPAFGQPHRNETRLNVRAVARSVPVAEQAARELGHDLAAGEVAVDVRMRARVQFKVGGVRSRHYSLQAFCSSVVIGLSPSSARSFKSVPCYVAIS
ncbi:NDR1/HIN1-like protein 10 [Phragmites australis]|uniref:NDR1/HIN1-like protein 10 n=1 Tax=Phragmites australis TaxID=29695 RepID=UPI002D783748|nr:NDR1/HIN1-like protein 10 [Phragmites australis]